jgi:two-component system sensor histidine kinase BaeS
VRLFSGLFWTLAGEALLVAALPGGALIWNLDHANTSYVAAQDRQSLAAFAAMAAAEIRGGTPVEQTLQAVQARFRDNLQPGDPAPPLLDRVALYSPSGRFIAGATPDEDGARTVRPVKLDGREVAEARIVRAPTPNIGSYAFVREQIGGILIAMAAVLALLLIGAATIASRWVRPQRALFEASKAVAQGDYNVDFAETGPIETRGTMRNLGRVARRFERLENARRTWLVTVSEEFRQPVQALTDKLVAIGERGMIGDREGFDDVVETTQRLSEMAEDLHAVALADLGRLPVTFATVDPVAIIHNAIWGMSRRAQAQNVAVEPGQLPQSTVPVKWDGGRIEQLFTALIENSLRYTPPGGRIALGLEGNRSAWRLIIDDSAPGVDIGLAQQLFEPFYRSTAVRGESVTNSGLGLATAQAIVEAHHGRIEASRSPLGGLRVTVILPGAPPTA